MKKRWLAICALMSISLLPQYSHAEKVFVYCSEAGPSTFNPQMASDGPTFNASSQMLFNRLVEFKYGGTEVVPALAKSWKITNGGKTYTFHLRTDVSFQTTSFFKPTRNFDADDVLFSFNRMRLKSNPYHDVNGGIYEYFQSMNLSHLIKDIRKVDAHTVVFELSQPDATFLADLAMNFAVVQSKEYADQLLKQKKPQELDLRPVGTGPFILTKYVKDAVIRYKANPSYFRGRPKLDKVVFLITPDSSVRYQKLRAGECDLIAEPSPTDIPAMKANPKIQVVSQPGANVGYLAMNVSKKPFSDQRVRLAVYHALNRENYIRDIFHGTATVAKNPMPSTIWGYNAGIKDYDYDTQEAKKLLKQAGYPNGFDTTLWTLPVSRPYNPNGKKMGELMQADLAKVGIRVKLVTYDWPTYLEKARKGEHQMLQFGWITDNGDPDNFLGVLLSCASVKGGSNVSQWCDKGFDRLIREGKRISSESKRAALYRKAQEIFHKEVPWVPIAHSTVFRALSRRVLNYKIGPIGVEDFYPLDLK